MPAKEKGKCSIFLKKSDNYAVSIAPTFNGLKTYPTKIGGVLSWITILILMGWLSAQFVNVVFFNHPTILVGKQNIDPKN